MVDWPKVRLVDLSVPIMNNAFEPQEQVIMYWDHEAYGRMAAKNMVDGLANRLAPDPRHGVEVIVGDEIDIHLYIIVEYGTRISAVADSVAHTVRFHVERALGMPVGAINVHVQGLRVSNADA